MIKKVLTTIILTLNYTVSYAIEDNPLLGEWVSDKNKSIVYSKSLQDLSASNIEALDMILGISKIIFTSDTTEIIYNDTKGKFEYRILQKNNLFIEIEVASSTDVKIYKYYLDGKYIYLKTDTKLLPRDYFRRVTK